MKKIYLLFISFLILFTSSTSFHERTMEMLTAYKWCISQEELDKQRDPNDPDDIYMLEKYYIYDETTCTSYTRWSHEPDKLVILTVPYYLGNEGEEVKVDKEVRNGKTYATFHDVKFDDSKVGKNKKGIYILEKYSDSEEAVILLIGNLTDQKLIIYSVTPSRVGGGKSEFEARPKD